MEKLLSYLQRVDRRVIYLVIAVVLVLSLIFGRTETGKVLPQVNSLFQAVDDVPQDKLILVGMTFENDTLTENGAQARAVIRHLMLRHKKFALLAMRAPQAQAIGEQLAGDLAKQYGYEYGKDWINFGYKLGGLAVLKPLTTDVPGTLRTDAHRKPLSEYPIMQNVRSMNDFGMLVEMTASSSVFDWIQVVQPATNPRLQIGYGCTGVMAAEAYPFLDSGQLVGMMPGLKGAADYEQLVDDLENKLYAEGKIANKFDNAKVTSLRMPAPARQLMFTQGLAHLAIIAFIALGNIGMWLGLRAKRRNDAGKAKS